MDISDLINRRGRAGPYYGPAHHFVELFGGRPVFIGSYAPDPNTFRDAYYYNARENQLYKKMRAGNQFVWKPVGED